MSLILFICAFMHMEEYYVKLINMFNVYCTKLYAYYIRLSIKHANGLLVTINFLIIFGILNKVQVQNVNEIPSF